MCIRDRAEWTKWGKPYFIAWTTTPWTLPSNVALGVGPKIDYVATVSYTHLDVYKRQPNNQGQVRVLVKDWKGGKLIDDGAFIYETAAQHKGCLLYTSTNSVLISPLYLSTSRT